jgi:hypothetical protein
LLNTQAPVIGENIASVAIVRSSLEVARDRGEGCLAKEHSGQEDGLECHGDVVIKQKIGFAVPEK